MRSSDDDARSAAGPPLAIVSRLEITGAIVDLGGAIAVIGTISVDVAEIAAEGPATDPTAAIVIQFGSLDLVGPLLFAERPIVVWAHRVGMPAALTIALEGPDVEPLRVSSPMSLAITLEAAEPLQRRLAQACA